MRRMRGRGRRLDENGHCFKKRRRLRSGKSLKVGLGPLSDADIADANKTAAQKEAEQEAALLAEMERAQKKLASVQELAHGKAYTESMKTTWRPPRFIRDLGPEGQQAVRDKHSIIIEGEDPPPAIEHFADMKIPQPILDYLTDKGISRPTPIQMQGIPTA